MTDHRIDTESSASRQHFIDSGRYLTMDGEDPWEVVNEALRAVQPDVLYETVTGLLTWLGSHTEWDSDVFDGVTEALVTLARTAGLPTVSDQDADALGFYPVADEWAEYEAAPNDEEE